MQERLIRDAECKSITGLNYKRRWKLAKDGKFPTAEKIPGTRSIAWRLSEINAWIAGEWQPHA